MTKEEKANFIEMIKWRDAYSYHKDNDLALEIMVNNLEMFDKDFLQECARECSAYFLMKMMRDKIIYTKLGDHPWGDWFIDK